MSLLLLFACPSPDSGDTPKDSEDTATGDSADTGDSGTTDTGDSGTVTLWPECPEASAYVGDTSWTGQLQVTTEGLYCSGGNEDRTLEQELATKMMLRVVPGDYPLPAADGSYTLSLPICTQTPDGGPQLGGEGSTEVSTFEAGGTLYTYIEGSQPLVDDAGASWTMTHTIVLVGAEGSAPDPLLLDGSEADAASGAAAELRIHPEGVASYDDEARLFTPCLDDSWAHNTHTLTFDGGEVTIDLYVGDDPIATAPSAFVRASGTLDGTSFEQEDYYALVYRPGHHHMSRDFAILLPTPIGDACAIRIEDVDDQEATTSGLVWTAGCDLAAIEARAVTGDTLTVEAP
jgi:hypothetical protein